VVPAAVLPAEGASTSFGAAHHPPGASLRAFFEPEGVAVVGVSAGSPGKSGNIIAGKFLMVKLLWLNTTIV